MLPGQEPTQQAHYQVHDQRKQGQQQQAHPQAGFQRVVSVGEKNIAGIGLDERDHAHAEQQGDHGIGEYTAHDQDSPVERLRCVTASCSARSERAVSGRVT